MLEKQVKRKRRHKRVRAKISGTARCPRLCVFRSNKHIYAQLINDTTNKTLVAASDEEVISKLKTQMSKPQLKTQSLKENSKIPLKGKILIAHQIGELIAKKALEKNIKKIVFDRGGYRYHGRVKALAEGARKGGLIF